MVCATRRGGLLVHNLALCQRPFHRNRQSVLQSYGNGPGYDTTGQNVRIHVDGVLVDRHPGIADKQIRQINGLSQKNCSN